MALYNMWAHAACFWISELFHPIMFAMPLALFIMGRHTGSFYESAKLLAPSMAIFRGIPTSPVRRLAVPALCLGAFHLLKSCPTRLKKNRKLPYN